MKLKLLEMDTDSFYFAMAEEKLDAIIRPELHEEFNKQRYGNCNDEFQPQYLPRLCCEKHKSYDKRTPGSSSPIYFVSECFINFQICLLKT